MGWIQFTQISEKLNNFLNSYDKLVILGIGNTIRGDDGLGPELLNKLSSKISHDNVILINCESTPENYTSLIRKENPSHIIIIDAVEFDSNPGDFLIINKDMIDNFNISTHSMPISFFIKFLETTLDVKILTMGIQPKEMNMTTIISKPVNDSIEQLTEILVKFIK